MERDELQKEQVKREEFKNILFDLSKTQEFLQDSTKRYDMYIRLEALYHTSDDRNGFRHFYSDIFSALTEIKNRPELGDINVLGQNLDYLRKHYQPINYDERGALINISPNLQKLYDHVNLDIARIEYSEAGDWKTAKGEAIVEVSRKIEETKTINEKQQRALRKKIQKQEQEYIAILGIFAAVVLTFNAGIAYSSSVLQNISEISIYRLMAVSLVVGLVMITVLAMLFSFIDRIVNGITKKGSGEIKKV